MVPARRATTLATLLLATGLAARPARAQPAPTAPQVAEGRQHFDRGVLLFDQGDHDGALAEFQRAWELSRRPSVLFNVAATCQALRRYGEAIAALRGFLAEARDAPPRQRREAEATLHQLEQLVARVRIAVDPPDAALTLDGRASAAGEELLVGPGTHRAEATRAGYAAAVEAFTIVSGQSRELRLSLAPLGAAPPPAVTVRRDSAAPASPGVTAPADPSPPPVGDDRPSGVARTMAWVAGGGAVALLGGAAVALAVREGAVGRFNDDARCLPDNGRTRSENCPDDESTLDTAGTLAWVGLAAGGALAVTSAVLFLASPRGRRGTTARVGCGAGPGDVGVACGATF